MTKKEVENGAMWEIGLGFRVFMDLMAKTMKTKDKHTDTVRVKATCRRRQNVLGREQRWKHV